MKTRKSDKKMRMALTLTMALASFFMIVYLLLSPGSVILRFALAVAALGVAGNMIANANGLRQSFGAYLVGSKRGINIIESLSKKSPNLWILFCDWGMTFSFGVAAYFIFRRQLDKRAFAAGIATIIAVMLFVYPFLPLIFNFISIPQVTAGIPTSPVYGLSIIGYALLAILILGGFSIFTLLIVFAALGILFSIAQFVACIATSGPSCVSQTLSTQVPGVAPIIPGVTIPLFAGVISLVILLVVHEFSHGVLARLAKVRIKEIGAVLFGIIPMGAFVEPDEHQIKKLPVAKQDRIFIAGISANLLTCLFFFVLTYFTYIYALPNLNTQGVLVTTVFPDHPAYGLLSVNYTILSWDGMPIRNSFDLAIVEEAYIPGNAVLLGTDHGIIHIIPTNSGKLGINTAPANTSTSYQIINFLYSVITLSFGLNFFVAIFNLLPIPGFDGWRIYQNRIKNKKILRFVSFLMIASLVINVLPWFWSVS
jgi:hypothetical protein